MLGRDIERIDLTPTGIGRGADHAETGSHAVRIGDQYPSPTLTQYPVPALDALRDVQRIEERLGDEPAVRLLPARDVDPGEVGSIVEAGVTDRHGPILVALGKRLDKWLVETDYSVMADHSAPDYELEETLEVGTAAQLRALFDETRRRILHLLLERAATISELAATLGIPKGTVGHHIGALEGAGLIRLIRTKKVRAIEAKYYGRTARTFLITSDGETEFALAPDHFLTTAAAEFATASNEIAGDDDSMFMSTLRYARIRDKDAAEFLLRLGELTHEFAAAPRGGETTFAMLAAFYPTRLPHLPDPMEEE